MLSWTCLCVCWQTETKAHAAFMALILTWFKQHAHSEEFTVLMSTVNPLSQVNGVPISFIRSVGDFSILSLTLEQVPRRHIPLGQTCGLKAVNRDKTQLQMVIIVHWHHFCMRNMPQQILPRPSARYWYTIITRILIWSQKLRRSPQLADCIAESLQLPSRCLKIWVKYNGAEDDTSATLRGNFFKSEYFVATISQKESACLVFKIRASFKIIHSLPSLPAGKKQTEWSWKAKSNSGRECSQRSFFNDRFFASAR